MKELLLNQYGLVRDAREVLFTFCETVSPEHFKTEVEGFGRGGSMRNLVVHIANSYQYWITAHCFGEKILSLVYANYDDVATCRKLYQRVDNYIHALLTNFEKDYFTAINNFTGERTFSASPFKVFTHVITHEFHHKGQILSIARHLGYTPVDTDVLR